MRLPNEALPAYECRKEGKIILSRKEMNNIINPIVNIE